MKSPKLLINVNCQEDIWEGSQIVNKANNLPILQEVFLDAFKVTALSLFTKNEETKAKAYSSNYWPISELHVVSTFF